MSINRWHEKFFETGSILRSTMVGTKSMRTEEMESAVVGTFKEDSHMFLRRAANRFSISKNSVSRILQDHGFHPDKIQTVQQLSEEDRRSHDFRT
jgi:transposase